MFGDGVKRKNDGFDEKGGGGRETEENYSSKT
jgi:hypothetical protein